MRLCVSTWSGCRAKQASHPLQQYQQCSYRTRVHFTNQIIHATHPPFSFSLSLSNTFKHGRKWVVQVFGISVIAFNYTSASHCIQIRYTMILSRTSGRLSYYQITLLCTHSYVICLVAMKLRLCNGQLLSNSL